MSLSTDLLKSEHVGIKKLKTHLSRHIKNNKPIIVTDRGVPVDVVVPYADMIELLDMVDELTDMKTIRTIMEGRKAIRSGAKGIPVSNLFDRVREKRK